MSASVQSPADPVDPRGLALRIQAGEQAAEAELIERYSRGVGIVVRRVVRDSDVTDDLCQETFRLVLEKVRRGELREPEKLSGFVSGLARNLAIEYLRQPRRTLPLDESGISLPDPKADPLDALLEKERVKAVRQVLRELTESRDREILYRFYLREEDKTEICKDFNLTSLHFNRVLHRARERFRTLINKAMSQKQM